MSRVPLDVDEAELDAPSPAATASRALRSSAALGPTQDVVVAGLQEALAAYADEMRELGRDFLAPMATTGTVGA